MPGGAFFEVLAALDLTHTALTVLALPGDRNEGVRSSTLGTGGARRAHCGGREQRSPPHGTPPRQERHSEDFDRTGAIRNLVGESREICDYGSIVPDLLNELGGFGSVAMAMRGEDGDDAFPVLAKGGDIGVEGVGVFENRAD